MTTLTRSHIIKTLSAHGIDTIADNAVSYFTLDGETGKELTPIKELNTNSKLLAYLGY